MAVEGLGQEAALLVEVDNCFKRVDFDHLDD